MGKTHGMEGSLRIAFGLTPPRLDLKSLPLAASFSLLEDYSIISGGESPKATQIISTK